MNIHNFEVIALGVNAFAVGNLYGNNIYKKRPYVFAFSIICTICSAIGLITGK